MFHVKQLKNHIKNEYILLVLGIINILLFSYPMMQGYINIGGYTGVTVGVIQIILFVLRKCKSETVKNVYINAILCLNLATGIIILNLSVYNYWKVETQEIKKEDVYIILGCEVNSDGTPSEMLKSRLQKGYDLSKDNDQCVFVVSGGYPDNFPISEGEAMANWLEENNIDCSRIIVDNEAKSTWENMRNSKLLLESHHIYGTMAAVTNDYHSMRTKWCANDNEMSISLYSAHTPWWLIPTYYIREAYGIVYYCASRGLH